MFIFILQICEVTSNYLPELPQMASGPICPAYACATSKIKKPFENTCVMEVSSTQYYLWECPLDSTANFCNTTSTSCQVPASSPSLSYVGDSCQTTADCYLSSCFKNTCRGLLQNTACVSHEQCDIGLRCSSTNFTCQPQIPVGGVGCYSYLDCVNWATCNFTFNSEKGVCVEYGSLPNGAVVSDCSGDFSYMCASGYCSKKYSFSATGKCEQAPLSNHSNPKMCSTDNDCVGIVNGGGVLSDCVCGYNNFGNKYCTPFIGDIQGVTMIISWNRALKLTGNCNTARRSSPNCMKSVGMLKNTTQATLGFYNYPLYLGNDQCIEIIYNNGYYLIENALGLAASLLLVLAYL